MQHHAVLDADEGRFAKRRLTIAATLRRQDRNVVDYVTEGCVAASHELPSPSNRNLQKPERLRISHTSTTARQWTRCRSRAPTPAVSVITSPRRRPGARDSEGMLSPGRSDSQFGSGIIAPLTESVNWTLVQSAALVHEAEPASESRHEAPSKRTSSWRQGGSPARDPSRRSRRPARRGRRGHCPARRISKPWPVCAMVQNRGSSCAPVSWPRSSRRRCPRHAAGCG
jgi:hypothetical protein